MSNRNLTESVKSRTSSSNLASPSRSMSSTSQRIEATNGSSSSLNTKPTVNVSELSNGGERQERYGDFLVIMNKLYKNMKSRATILGRIDLLKLCIKNKVDIGMDWYNFFNADDSIKKFLANEPVGKLQTFLNLLDRRKQTLEKLEKEKEINIFEDKASLLELLSPESYNKVIKVLDDMMKHVKSAINETNGKMYFNATSARKYNDMLDYNWRSFFADMLTTKPITIRTKEDAGPSNRMTVKTADESYDDQIMLTNDEIDDIYRTIPNVQSRSNGDAKVVCLSVDEKEGPATAKVYSSDVNLKLDTIHPLNESANPLMTPLLAISNTRTTEVIGNGYIKKGGIVYNKPGPYPGGEGRNVCTFKRKREE